MSVLCKNNDVAFIYKVYEFISFKKCSSYRILCPHRNGSDGLGTNRFFVGGVGGLANSESLVGNPCTPPAAFPNFVGSHLECRWTRTGDRKQPSTLVGSTLGEVVVLDDPKKSSSSKLACLRGLRLLRSTAEEEEEDGGVSGGGGGGGGIVLDSAILNTSSSTRKLKSLSGNRLGKNGAHRFRFVDPWS